MPIPDFQTLMRPVLGQLADGGEHRFADLVAPLADQFSLTPDERAQLLPSGRQILFRNRVHWSAFHLFKAGLLERPRRGWLKLADRGRVALASKDRINMGYLQQYPEYVAFRQTVHTPGNGGAKVPDGDPDERTPEELVEAGFSLHRKALATELLAKVKSCTPAFFEQLVVDLLVAMGYGGSRRDAGQAVGQSGDGGIDGIIKEDRLGLDAVFVQAKRWEATVGRPAVQAFAGSLEGHRARKGVFITTSDYSSEARDYVGRIEKRIVLIGGEQLADLMIEHGVGVADVTTYALKRVDSDYFEDSD